MQLGLEIIFEEVDFREAMGIALVGLRPGHRLHVFEDHLGRHFHEVLCGIIRSGTEALVSTLDCERLAWKS